MARWGLIRGYSQCSRTGKRRYVGARGFAADHDFAPRLHEWLYGERYPGVHGVYAPLCTRVEVHEYALPTGQDLVIARYETPRIPGRGTVYFAPGDKADDRDMDVNIIPERIRGIDEDTGDQFEIVRGPGTFPRAAGTFILATAYRPRAAELDGLLERRDHINDASMANFLNAPAYTLRYALARVQSDEASGLVYVDHIFDYEPRGWNNLVWSRRMVSKVVAVPVLDDDGEPIVKQDGTIRWRAAHKWFPAQKVTGTHTRIDADGNWVRYHTYGAEKPSPRMLYRDADFSDLDKIVVW